MIALLIAVGIVVVIAAWVIGIYNGLVRLRNQVKNAWAQIDVQLKRRHDLIPNLVETVKGYMGHERQTLENVTQARNLAVRASGVADQAKADGFPVNHDGREEDGIQVGAGQKGIRQILPGMQLERLL